MPSISLSVRQLPKSARKLGTLDMGVRAMAAMRVYLGFKVLQAHSREADGRLATFICHTQGSLHLRKETHP